MSYRNTKQDPKEAFRHWLRFQSELLAVAMEEGFTEEQAFELLKIYRLGGIEANTRLISGNY